MTRSEALKKAEKYCAYQDRCQQEVRSKLYDIGTPHEYIEDIITDLINDRFIDEERFARSFTRGKFNIKSWGRTKIVAHLKQKKISAYCIKAGLQEIDEEDYREKLKALSFKKMESLSGSDFEVRGKTAQFLINKGFESDLVWEIVKD